MNEKIIVLVTDRGDSKHGEISVVDDPHRAEKLVETLLEAGFEQDRIRVFAGKQSDFQVSQRPVVALVGEEEEAQVGVTEQEAPVSEPAPAAEEPQTAGGEGKESDVEEEVAAAAQTGAPVKFSSLFRSA